DVVDPHHTRIGVQLFGGARRADEDAAVDATRFLRVAGRDDHVVTHFRAHLLHAPAERLGIEVLGSLAIGGLDLEVHDSIWHRLRLYTRGRRLSAAPRITRAHRRSLASYTIADMFNHPDMSGVAHLPPDDRDRLDAWFQTRVQADVSRGRHRGHFYQLTADLTMMEHRPDYAKRFYDTIPSFRNRLRQTGEDDTDNVEIIAESLQHLPMYVLY